MNIDKTMRNVSKFNDDWHFHGCFSQDMVSTFEAGVPVRLPHNAVDLELNYFDERAYQQAFCYQKQFSWSKNAGDLEATLVFDGAMADTEVWLNGHKVACHADGYTPFEAHLTPFLMEGTNLLTVKLDGSENPAIPPFGGCIDYLTYAGLYRDVWLRRHPVTYISNIKVETENVLADAKTVRVRCWLNNTKKKSPQGRLVVQLCTTEGAVLDERRAAIEDSCVETSFNELTGLDMWDVECPTLYEIRVTAHTSDGEDNQHTRFGFRSAQFTPDGFFLNGRLLKIRGLNRHQSYPYVGYAMGRSAQEKDAEILKTVLKCNLVRTSHYPQSKWFLDRCDEIGLLVLEEIPGWQHIGGPQWKEESVENVRRMIRRDWNHPSIVLWGVRINESQDDHDFYAKTNSVARELDATRQTGGIRFLERSELLEDVYTINDFVLGAGPEWLAGREPVALREPRSVTGLDHDVPYLVTEHNGHMFPTKRTDPESRQAEHVIRHLQVLDAAYADKRISGTIGWCMFDYNTHKDFGAGDHICHHGVLDIFREPKFAAYAYTSQCESSEQVVLEPVTFWARGERDCCDILPIVVLTNCDYIDFQFGEFEPKRIYPDRENFPHLPHPPVVIDQRNIKLADLGEWGFTWRDGCITGYVNDVRVAEVKLHARPVPTTLEVVADSTVLRADEKDATRVIVRVKDQVGRILPLFDDAFKVAVSGPAALIGPDMLTFRAGTGGFWIETSGDAGTVELTVSTRRLGSRQVTLTVSRG